MAPGAQLVWEDRSVSATSLGGVLYSETRPPARVLRLALIAARYNINFTIDAEEAERLSLSLDVFERVYRDASLLDWDGLGLAVQAFQKRAIAIIDWLEVLAREVGRRIPVRLVKGAYWDTEVKRAQEAGLAGYPVFTHKSHSDLAYLAGAQALKAKQFQAAVDTLEKVADDKQGLEIDKNARAWIARAYAGAGAAAAGVRARTGTPMAGS